MISLPLEDTLGAEAQAHSLGMAASGRVAILSRAAVTAKVEHAARARGLRSAVKGQKPYGAILPGRAAGARRDTAILAASKAIYPSGEEQEGRDDEKGDDAGKAVGLHDGVEVVAMMRR